MTVESVTGMDFETHLIQPTAIAPRVICGSFYDSDGLVVLGNHPDDGLRNRILGLLVDESKRIVTHNGASFDLQVIAKNFPEFIPLIFKALEDGRVHDTKIREKLIVIGDQGNMRLRRMPNGTWTNITYDLATLEQRYLGVKSRKEEKGHLTKEMIAQGIRGDAWRWNFDALDGMRAKDYPKAAWDYAAEDAKNTVGVFWAQHSKFASLGINPRAVEALHVAAAFCLYGMSAFGLRIDPVAVGRLRRRLEHDLGNDSPKIALLIKGGVLRPAKPRRFQEGSRTHVENCPKDGYCNCPVTGKQPRKHTETCKRRGDCGCPLIELEAEKSSVFKAGLHALIVSICKEHDLPVKVTEKTEDGGGGNVSADAEVLDDLRGLNEYLDAYAWRQTLIGLQDRELPRMTIPLDRPQIVHPHYDELKVTGRTSCSASELVPSGNIQNVDPRARECYIPRDGFLLLSKDYSGMELVTLAQVVYNTLGYSSLRDQINRGIEPHAFLGAQICYAQHEGFRKACQAVGRTSREHIYEAFLSLKAAGGEDAKLFKIYRTLAKPTGLGYPGGLGPKTFVAMCKSQYGDALSELGVPSPDMDQAVFLRDLWLDVYPEMRKFFEIVKSRRDGANDQVVIDKKTGLPKQNSKFWYVSPLGMRRNGCSFTEAANGVALQTPGAELAKMGMISVCRAAWDPSLGSILYGRLFPIAFIHDEVLSEIRDDELRHEVAMEAARLMVVGGQIVVPDVKLTANAALMRRWRKDADPVFDKVTGRLAIWEPKEMLV
jgi:hypothetical protein